MTRRGSPRYPQLCVSTRSRNPLALVAAVREEMRLARAEHQDISRFTDEALACPDHSHVVAVAARWVGEVHAA